jgi:hypothetical protein
MGANSGLHFFAILSFRFVLSATLWLKTARGGWHTTADFKGLLCSNCHFMVHFGVNLWFKGYSFLITDHPESLRPFRESASVSPTHPLVVRTSSQPVNNNTCKLTENFGIVYFGRCHPHRAIASRMSRPVRASSHPVSGLPLAAR